MNTTQIQSTGETPPIEGPHVLESLEILPVRNWKEELERWKGPMQFEDRINWLHSNVRVASWLEEFIFCLEVADGYGDRVMVRESDPFVQTIESYESIYVLRQRIKRKAFAMICNRFFEKEASCPLIGFDGKTFPKLIWFFREYRGKGGHCNLRPEDTATGLGRDGGKHYIEVACNFASEFALNAWTLLNGHWFLGDLSPGQTLAEPHLWEITNLLWRTGGLRQITTGQYLPRPEVFSRLFDTLVTNYPHNTPTKVTQILELIISNGSGFDKDLAEALYIARLQQPSRVAQLFFKAD